MAASKQQSPPGLISWPLYWAVMLFAYPYLKLKYRFRSIYKFPKKQVRAPFVLLCNHGAALDFLYAFITMAPIRMHTVTATFFYNNKLLAWLLKAAGCIPKEQFKADLSSVRTMMRVIKAGNSTLLFPEGEVNGTGINDAFLSNTATLCRKLGADIYTLKFKGSYLSTPKWAVTKRRGRVEAEFDRLLTGQELAGLTADELQQRINKALMHDDNLWQAEAKIPYKGKRLAENLHYMLYLCPKCGGTGVLEGKFNTLRCTACNNQAQIDEYGAIRPVNCGDVVFENVTLWLNYQKQELKKAIQGGTLSLVAECHLQLHIDPKRISYQNVGEGTVRLDNTGLYYDGTRYGERVSIFFEAGGIYKLPYWAGRNFIVPGSDEIISIAPKDPRLVMPFVVAMPLLYEHINHRPA